MEVITNLNSLEDVAKSYKDNGVSASRQKSLKDKFEQVPSKFTVHGLTFVTLNINGKEIKNVPAFAINEDGSKYVLVGTFRQTYTDKTEPTIITKKTKNENKLMVVNNKNVHEVAQGMSEAELIVYCIGKSFHTETVDDPFRVYVPEYINNQPVFYDAFTDLATKEKSVDNYTKTMKRIVPKSYVKIVETIPA